MSEQKQQMDAERMKKIDAALARAKAQKEAVGANQGNPGESIEDRTKRLAAERTQRQEEKDKDREARRQERQAELDKQRAERKQARDQKREARLAELAQRKPAHLSKVEKAAANLPPMNEETQAVFDAASKLNRTDIEILASHLSFEARKNATLQATSANLKVGMQVTVISGQARFIGQTGTVTKVQRIRCFVQLDESGKEIYLFTSDVAPDTEVAEVAAATGQELPASMSTDEHSSADEPAASAG